MTVILRRLTKFNIQQILCFDRKILYPTFTLEIKKFINMSLQDCNTAFEGTGDRFNGILIDTQKENCNIETFKKKLTYSLNHWKIENRRGIWFKIALEHSNLVPILAENGFDFHHAKNGYVMMYKWLPSTSCGIPTFAHTMLAVGAVVIKDETQVLTVKEKGFLTGYWKFPGGMVEPGENIIDAALREVKEETNVNFEFESLISIMHADKGLFNCSDLYILVSGKALTNEIIKCDREIADCTWMDINEYLDREDVTDFNKRILHNYLEYRKNNVKINYIKDRHKLSKRDYTMYSISFNK